VLDALFDGWSPEQAAEAIAELSPAADSCARRVVGSRGRQGHEGREDHTQGPPCASRRRRRARPRSSNATRRATSASHPRASCAACRRPCGLHRERVPAERSDAGPRTSAPARRGGGRPPARAGALHRDHHALRDVEGDLRRPRAHAGDRVASSRSWPRRRRRRALRRTSARSCSRRCTCIRSAPSASSSLSGRISSSRRARARARRSASSCRCSARSTTRRCARPRRSSSPACAR
jgi:hypothetical protein